MRTDNSAHTVKITGYGSKGEGVARLGDGRVAFIRGAARDDVCEIAIISERPRSCRAEITDVIQPSRHRIEPDCPAYPACGGCDFRHITYEEELRAKLDRVNDALGRIGGASIRADEIITAGRIDGYRNKAVFHVARQNGETNIGFYRAETHDVFPIERCLLLRDELNDALQGLLSGPPPEEGEITFRTGSSSFSGVVAVAGGAEDACFSENSSDAGDCKDSNDSRVTGGDCETGGIRETGGACETGGANGAEYTEEEIDGLVFQVSRASFFQVNIDVALPLYQKAREYAALVGGDILVDLYCGVGSLTLFIGRDAGYAIGVESNPAAVDDAMRNALRNRIGHIDFACVDVARWDAGGIRPACVVADPPRKGLSAGAVRKILGLSPERIVYISCDPATLSRDTKLLQGYKPLSITAFDMFPRTANVECCLLLVRM